LGIFNIRGVFGKKVCALADVTSQDVLDFSQLSGDQNPLHIDSEYASRTQFRGKIAHGFISIVYVFQVINKFININTSQLILVDFKFLAPCREADRLSINLTFSNNEIHVNILDIENRTICQGRILLALSQKKRTEHYFKLKTDNSNNEFILDKDMKKNIPLFYTLVKDNDRNAKEKLSGLFYNSQLSLLFSLSTIVGMYLPGKRALFRSFELQFEEQDTFSDQLIANAKVDRIYNAGGSLEFSVNFSTKKSEIAKSRLKSNILSQNKEAVSLINFKSMSQFKGLLKNKNALVLGGSRGIGAATVQVLANAGCNVLLQYNNGLKDAQRIQKHIRKNGMNCEILKLDLKNTNELDSFSNNVNNELLGKLDIIVNSIATHFLPNRLDIFSKKAFKEMLDTDLYGVSCLILDLIHLMQQSERGKIVNIGSLITQNPVSGQLPYGIVKAGIESLSKSLAHELRHKNIDVNLVSPAMTSTSLTSHINTRLVEKLLEDNGQESLLEPMDVAKVVLFFCSGMSDKVSGQRLFINNKEANYL
jgi:NAD(P)-dependent dehydrogenase (short-subunit alcohol dehydrogenase family)